MVEDESKRACTAALRDESAAAWDRRAGLYPLCQRRTIRGDRTPPLQSRRWPTRGEGPINAGLHVTERLFIPAPAAA